ncbi:unnamed protein product, partial [Oppiella nova]
MKKMFPMIKQCLDELLNTLEMYANDKKEVDMKLMYGNLTMDVISTCAFATKTNSYKDPNSPFIKNAHKALNPKSYRLVLSIMLPKFVMKFINMKHAIEETSCQFFFKLTRLIINDRKNKKDKANEVSDEFDSNESHHVNEGKEELEIQKKVMSGVEHYITDDEILANAWIFFVAGYETTATTLSFATYELALNPDVQQKLYEEVMSSVDTNGEI